MTKKKRRYESRVFDGRIIHSAEIERIHKEVLDFKKIEAVSDSMRELMEDLWPELVSKLPPKRPHGYKPMITGAQFGDRFARGHALKRRSTSRWHRSSMGTPR
jgi:hypothetical protein